MPRQRLGCQKRAALGGHGLMLEGGTHGTLLCSGGDFEAISGCGAPLSAPPPKDEGRLCGCALGVGGWKNMHGHVHQAPIEYWYN